MVSVIERAVVEDSIDSFVANMVPRSVAYLQEKRKISKASHGGEEGFGVYWPAGEVIRAIAYNINSSVLADVIGLAYLNALNNCSGAKVQGFLSEEFVKMLLEEPTTALFKIDKYINQ